MQLTRRKFALGSAAAVALPNLLIPRSSARAADFTLSCGITTAPTHPVSLRLAEASKRIADQSSGRVDLRIFPASQMGGDVDMLAQTHSGALHFQLISGITASVMVPGAAINGIGFAFKNYDQVWAAMDGDLGMLVRQDFNNAGFFVADKMWDNGYRQLTNSRRPINNVADVIGLKVRVPVGAVWTSLWASLRASPTSIDLGELYSALQTKIVDGQENALPLITSNKIYEVQKYCSLTSHMWDGWWMLGHKDTWNKLPDDIKDVISRNIVQATLDERNDIRTSTQELQQKLVSLGLIFNEPDRDSFREALRTTTYYKDWRKKFGDKAWETLEHYVGSL